MRQKIIKTILIPALLFILSASGAFAASLEFAQIGNVLYTKGDTEADKYLYFLELSLRKKNPEFAVFLGGNVSKSSEENTLALMQRLYRLKIPYYLLFGSTDTDCISGIDKYAYHDIIAVFNPRQKFKPNFYYFKPNRHFICIVLDDSSNFMSSKHGEIPDEQFIWLDKLLKRHSKKTAVIFQHTPLEAPENYGYSMLNADKYREILSKHKNVILISSGKYGSEFQIKDNSGITHISAPAFNSEHAYQLIKIDYEKNKIKSITAEKVKV